jgi:spore maturation protein CgeB
VRVLVVDTYYPAFLAAHYAANPGLEHRSYEEQSSALMARRFGTSDAYSYHLRQLGHEAVEIVANCDSLQLAWAREHRQEHKLVLGGRLVPARIRAVARRANLVSVALAQVDAFQPDVVYLQDLWFFGTRTLASLRRSGRLVVGQLASALPPLRRLQSLDLITTALPQYVERFRAMGLDSELFGIAFYERVVDSLRAIGVDPAAGNARRYGLTFVGGLSPQLYAEGTRVLERVAAELPLEVWGFGADELPATSAIRRRYRGEAWGLDMYTLLAQSGITLNRHGEVAGGYAANMRLFEATGVGSLLVTDNAKNLSDLFDLEHEVVTYETPEDLIEKLRHYAEHEEEREQIAKAGQKRTLREHTYARRIPDLAEILEARLRR